MLSVFQRVPLRYMGLDWLSNGVSISEAQISQKIAPNEAGELRPRHLQRKQVVVGLRSTRKFGIPQPWRPAGSRLGKKIPWFSEGCHIFGVAKQMTRLLPKLYGIAEGMCLLEMSRCGNKPHSSINQVVAVTRLSPDYMKSYDQSAEFWLKQLQPQPGHDRWTSFMGLRQLLPNSVAHCSLIQCSFADYTPFSVTLFQMIILYRLLFMWYRFVA